MKKQLFMVLALILAAPSQATIFKWKDPATGRERYTQIPPPPPTYYELFENGITRTIGGSATRSLSLDKKDSEQEEGEAKDDKDVSKQSREEIFATNCKTVQENLANLKTDGPIAQKGEDGQLREIDAEERQRRITESQRDVDYYCSSKS